MHDKTITIYNFQDGYWYPTVISGVHMEIDTAANLTVNGINNVGNVFVSIPATKTGMVNTATGPKQYVRPKEYETSDPAECFTLKPETDFIMEGSWNSVEEDDDYDSGFYHEMNNLHDGVHLVNMAEFLTLIPHIEVGAR